MTPPTSLHPATQTSPENHAGEIMIVRVLGGTKTLSYGVMTAMGAAITP